MATSTPRRLSLLATAGVLLATLSWIAIVVATLTAFGDPAPGQETRSTLEGKARFISSLVVVSITSYVTALWISGLTFSAARLRSSIIIALCAGLWLLGVWMYIADNWK